MRLLVIAGILCVFSGLANAQKLTQTIRGKVLDKDLKSPLIGVNLIILGSDPVLGTSTNENGEFKFEGLHVGRYDIEVRYIGYQPKIVNDILIGEGKQVVLSIELVESVENLKEITVKARKHKGEPLNKMAMISARSFSVDETKRYAGSFDDPARLASGFAGVTGDPSGNNDIIIRGNSPRGLSWRLEGIEIPNPNHFSEEGASGGPISILNNNVLGNSDFFTGAFPAEFGDAYSGVFDIKLRNGNNEKREYSTKAGILGIDFSMEGPFRKNDKSSYLVNYRYSTLALLNATGIKIEGDAVPKFQDAAINLIFPTRKLGTFKLFGIGGDSHIIEEDPDSRNQFGTDMGVLGLTNTFTPDEKSYLKTTLAITGSGNKWMYHVAEGGQMVKEGEDDLTYSNYIAKMVYNRKLNVHHTLQTGASIRQINYKLYSEYYGREKAQLFPQVDQNGGTQLFQSYLNWRYRLSNTLTFLSGMHYTYFFLNGNQSLEPRLGMKWQFNPKQSLSAGFGKHSKVESLTNYLAVETMDDGFEVQHNKMMDFLKARHYVIGYENRLGEDVLLKLEMYYQDLYQVPIEDDPTSSFSILNAVDGFHTEKLVNSGVGYNYGIEATLEKFFSKSYYFMGTASLFESKYKGADQIWRNTRYNSNYVLNVLSGKEFKLKNNGVESTLTTSIRATWAGGLRYTPINLDQSVIEGKTVYLDELAYTEQWSPFIRYDFKISYRKNKRKTTRVWELDIQNVTNRLNIAGEWFNEIDNDVETYTQLGLLPTISYRIEF